MIIHFTFKMFGPHRPFQHMYSTVTPLGLLFHFSARLTKVLAVGLPNKIGPLQFSVSERRLGRTNVLFRLQPR